VKKIFEMCERKNHAEEGRSKTGQAVYLGMINPVRLERLLERVMEKSLVAEGQK